MSTQFSPEAVRSLLPNNGDTPLGAEFVTYIRELPRLVAEGEEGRYAVIKGDKVLSTWDTYRDALHAGHEHFEPGDFSVNKVDEADLDRLAVILARKGAPCQS